MELVCSKCHKEILGSIVVASDAGEPDEPMLWGEMMVYPSTAGGFILVHPNCFKELQDELLRQERGAVLNVGFMKVEDAREALQIG